MNTALAILAALTALWALPKLKRSRPDGDPLPLHPYRRLMLIIMPGRNESAVYFDAWVDARKLLAFLEARPDATLTHCAVAAAALALAENPRMNRFVAAKRLYQRRGRWITFSMKRAKTAEGFDRQAQLATVKLEMRENEPFPDLRRRIDAEVGRNRSGEKTHADREFALFDALPRPVLQPAAAALRWLDDHNLLPGAFIATDPLYTSLFLANLGSLDMDAAFHHLYEYGNCPLFLVIGRLKDEIALVEGQVTAIPRLHLRFTYDERIDDGLNARFGVEAVVRILEDPERYLGER